MYACVNIRYKIYLEYYHHDPVMLWMRMIKRIKHKIRT